MKIILALVLAYFMVLALLYTLQHKFMYFPPLNVPALETTNLEMVEVSLNTDYKDIVPIWWHAPKENEPIVMYFHGNGSSIHSGHFIYQHFIDQNYGIIAVEYPGYSSASGKPNEEAIISSAKAGYDFLVAQGITGERIHLYGTSLGAGVAIQLASCRDVASLILEAPFYSMVDMAKLTMPMFAFRAIIKDKYESFKALESINVPLLWLHGTEDAIIPVAEGRRLFNDYHGPKESWVIEGANHSNIWVSGGKEQIMSFLNDHSL